ncbi:MAG: Gfo/Idh/MocA family oxidoreductase [Caldilineaceae bacterium]
MRIGLIGLGDMGMYQARSFAQVADCELVAGADPSAVMRNNFSESFPNATAYSSPEDLLAGAQVDGIIIAVPTGCHQQVANTVLNARIPVLLEKPMARTVAQCAQLIERAEQQKTLLMVAHCRRFDPYWTRWGKMVTAGELGTPIL